MLGRERFDAVQGEFARACGEGGEQFTAGSADPRETDRLFSRRDPSSSIFGDLLHAGKDDPARAGNHLLQPFLLDVFPVRQRPKANRTGIPADGTAGIFVELARCIQVDARPPSIHQFDNLAGTERLGLQDKSELARRGADHWFARDYSDSICAAIELVVAQDGGRSSQVAQSISARGGRCIGSGCQLGPNRDARPRQDRCRQHVLALVLHRRGIEPIERRPRKAVFGHLNLERRRLVADDRRGPHRPPSQVVSRGQVDRHAGFPRRRGLRKADERISRPGDPGLRTIKVAVRLGQILSASQLYHHPAGRERLPRFGVDRRDLQGNDVRAIDLDGLGKRLGGFWICRQ